VLLEAVNAREAIERERERKREREEDLFTINR